MKTATIPIPAIALALALAIPAARAATTDAYVQDGLFHHWDGVENAGVGLHVSSTNKWKDLAGTMDLTVEGGAAFTDNSLRRSSSSGKRMAYGASSITTAKTVQLVIKRKEYAQYAVLFSLKGWVDKGDGLLTFKNDTIGSTYYLYHSAYNVTHGSFTTVTLLLDSKNIFLNTSPVGSGSGSETWNSGMTTAFAIGGRATNSTNGFVGDVYACRIYDRELTADEIAANCAVDVTRFVNGDIYTIEDRLDVSASPEEFGSPTPAYGMVRGLAAGDSLDVSCPAAWTNAAETIAAACTGWTLYDSDGNAVSNGTGNALTYVHPDPIAYRRLVWNFDTKYKVSAVSTGNGSIALASDWVDNGGVATLTATPAEGYAFYKWTGAVDSQHNKSNPLDLAIAAPTTVTGLFARCCYVSTDGNDENDGLTWATAKATVGAAVALHETAPCVMVSNGIYSITESIRLTNGVVVAGTGDRGAIVKLTASPASGNASRCAFYIAHADAAIRNIAVAGRYAEQARGIYMSSGLIDSCSVTNHKTVSRDQKGAGIYMTGGVVRKSLISHNYCTTSGGSSMGWGGGLYMTAGLVENCNISSNQVGETNSSGGSSSSCGGGVYMENGTLRNSLITRNTVKAATETVYGTGVYSKGGTIENCTIAGNYQSNRTSSKALYLAGAATVRNCIIWDNSNAASDAANWGASVSTYVASHTCSLPALTGTDNVESDPTFTDAQNWDYRIGYGPAVNTAQAQSWMAAATDLDGNARISGSAPDMGCYEYVSSGIACGLTASAAGALDEDDVTLEALVDGDNLSGLTYTWTVTDTAGGVTATNGSDLSTVTLRLPAGLYDVTLAVSTALGETATATAEQAVRIYGSDVYVDPAGGNAYPYSSQETAATNLIDAMSAATGGTTVHLLDGWHRIARSISLLSPIRIVSANGPGATTLFGKATSGAPLIVMNHSQALLSGVTVTGKDSSGYQPGQWSAIQISSGTVSNCVVRDHLSSNNSVNGAGVRMAGGRVVDCVFSNNVTYSSGGSNYDGGALYASSSSALVDRCLFVNNSTSYSGTQAYPRGGGAYLSAGTIRNSVFARNTCKTQGYGGGLAVAGTAAARNCTVVSNTAATGSGGIHATVDTATVRNSIAWGNALASGARSEIGGVATCYDACYTNNPSFFGQTGREYAIRSGSPCRNAGVNEDWMAGALDFYGNPRLRKEGDTVDIGAAESQTLTATAIFIQ